MRWAKNLHASAVYQKARFRLGRVDASTASLWADSNLWATQEYLDEFRRTGEPAALQEAKKGAIGLLAAIDSLLDRTQ